MTWLSNSCVALLLAASFAIGVPSMMAPVPVLLLTGMVVVMQRADLDTLRRAHAGMLVGTALAWVLLPHSIFDFREHGLGPIPTDIQGCQVMARAGFPIQQISAHGGGGWRLGYHLASDNLAHAGNCLILTVVSWLAIGFVPRRLWRRIHLVVWLSFLPLWLYGLCSMLRWWD